LWGHIKDTVHAESRTRKELLQQIILKKAPSKKSHIKITVITFFDTKGINYNEFASEEGPVLSEEYLDAINS